MTAWTTFLWISRPTERIFPPAVRGGPCRLGAQAGRLTRSPANPVAGKAEPGSCRWGGKRPLAPTYADSRSIRVGRGGGQISPWIRNPSFNAACLTMSGPHSHRSLMIHLIASLPGRVRMRPGRQRGSPSCDWARKRPVHSYTRKPLRGGVMGVSPARSPDMACEICGLQSP